MVQWRGSYVVAGLSTAMAVALLWLARGSETVRMERLKAAACHGGFAASPGLISGPGTGIPTTHGTSGQRSVGHDG